MLDPCSVPFRHQWASGAPFGLSMGPVEAVFVSLDVFRYPGGAIAGSWAPFCSSFEAICCFRASFLASVWHLFARFRGQLYIPSVFHTLHSNKKPTGFQSGNNNSFASPIRSVSQICCKKCAASSQLMPREARHLRLVYIYIYIIYICIKTCMFLNHVP